ncbi:MAG TPA: hypothetical protein PLA94_15660, partial [Myxococcota bacterium]|nr:hypothetical protein [Myxococcota bacterium]
TGNSGQLQSQIDVLQGTGGTLATQTSVAELDARVNAGEVEDLPDLDSRVEALELNQAALVPSGTIAVWSGDIANIPSGWRLCNGANGTPDLRDSFVMGAGGGADPWSTGGANQHQLSVAEMPAHSHGGVTSGQSNDHVHTGTTSADAAWNSGDVYSDGGGVDFVPDIWDNYYIGANGTYVNGTVHDHTFTSNGVSAGHYHTIPSEGSGVSFDSRPAYVALAYIIKV